MILQGFFQTCFVLSSSEPKRPTQLLSGQAPACSSSKMISTADLCNSSTLMALQMPCRRKSACLMLRRSPQSPVRLPSIWEGRIHLGGTAMECKSQSPLVVLLCIVVYSMLFHCGSFMNKCFDLRAMQARRVPSQIFPELHSSQP